MASEIWSSTFREGNLVVDIGRVTFQVILRILLQYGLVDCSQGFLLSSLLATIQDHPAWTAYGQPRQFC